jgi:type IV pilus assembly protein PilM
MARACIGVDIGSNSVKAVQLKQTGKGWKLVNFGIEPLPPQTIVDGAIMNQGAVVDAIKNLRALLKFSTKEVASAVSGHSVIIKKIKVPEMTKEELEDQIPWEAEHHIPFSKDDVEIDHQLLSGGPGQGGQMEILLVAAKKEIISDYGMVLREAKLQPVVMDVTAFTIQNAFEVNYAPEPGQNVAVINVGATLSTINIVNSGASAFTRDVNTGGNAFTEEIQKRLNVGQDQAEAWKIGGLGAGAQEVLPQEVEGVMAEVADQMAGKFQRSLDFFLSSNSATSLTKVYLCGGTAKVVALQKSLQDKSHTPVEVLDPFRKLVIDEKKFDMAFLRDHAPEAAVAVGLALRRPGDKA